MPNAYNNFRSSRMNAVFTMLLAAVLYIFAPVAIAVEVPPQTQNSDSIEVMETFDRQNSAGKEAITDRKKHLIMFIIGVPLLLFIIITGALGVAMVVYGKPVFLLHMIFAGLSITLMIVHAIVGLVWFNPF